MTQLTATTSNIASKQDTDTVQCRYLIPLLLLSCYLADVRCQHTVCMCCHPCDATTTTGLLFPHLK